jgi:hypothetical protein
MSWQCKLIDYSDRYRHQPTLLQIGDMFYGPTEEQYNVDPDQWMWVWHFCSPKHLSEYYKNNNSHRNPLLVMLPPHDLFCVDGMCWDHGKYYGGWTVTGEAPLITLSPSINMVGSYHGWLQNGILSDDCEGRKYE